VVGEGPNGRCSKDLMPKSKLRSLVGRGRQRGDRITWRAI